jgi:hypothetical protein
VHLINFRGTADVKIIYCIEMSWANEFSKAITVIFSCYYSQHNNNFFSLHKKFEKEGAKFFDDLKRDELNFTEFNETSDFVDEKKRKFTKHNRNNIEKANYSKTGGAYCQPVNLAMFVRDVINSSFNEF